MIKVFLYIAQSLDGYIATADGEVAWLDQFNNIVGEDYGYKKFIETIDTVIQGNTTYQQFETKHEDKNSYVFTQSPEKHTDDHVQFVQGSPKEFLEQLDEKTHQNIWLVGGAKLLANFLNEEQVNEIIIFTMPVILGTGIALFDNLTQPPLLKLTHSKTYKNGVIESCYSIQK
jgi:dihydrofolate reductase